MQFDVKEHIHHHEIGFSEMRLSRFDFHSECGAFCTSLILNEFKQLGFSELIMIRC